MTKVIYNTQFPAIDRDEFLTPFDRMFDQIVETAFPDVAKTVGVKPFQGTAYPKVNVYEFEDKVGLIANGIGKPMNRLKPDKCGNTNKPNGRESRMEAIIPRGRQAGCETCHRWIYSMSTHPDSMYCLDGLEDATCKTA